MSVADCLLSPGSFHWVQKNKNIVWCVCACKHCHSNHCVHCICVCCKHCLHCMCVCVVVASRAQPFDLCLCWPSRCCLAPQGLEPWHVFIELVDRYVIVTCKCINACMHACMHVCMYVCQGFYLLHQFRISMFVNCNN